MACRNLRGLRKYLHPFLYETRLREVLRGDYPAIWHWFGDDEFEQLADVYIRQSPSAHYSLRWLGKVLEAFIYQHLVPEQGAALSELVCHYRSVEPAESTALNRMIQEG